MKTAAGATGARTCDNCGAGLTGPFCSRCGQESRDPARIGLGELVREWLGDVFTFDSRVLRTLWPLVRRPGVLTVEYLEGRRVRYVPPLRLFVFLSLVMFLVMGLTGVRFNWKVTSGGREVAHQGSAVTTAGAAAAAADAGTPAGEDGTGADGRAGAPDASADANLVERINRRLIDRMPHAMLVLVPVMAFFVWLLHRRRIPLYLPHLIFSLHVYSFWFLVMTVAGLLDALLPTGVVGSLLILLSWPLYLLLAQRRVYGGGWLANLLRSAFLGLAQTLAFFVVMIALLMAIVRLG